MATAAMVASRSVVAALQGDREAGHERVARADGIDSVDGRSGHPEAPVGCGAGHAVAPGRDERRARTGGAQPAGRLEGRRTHVVTLGLDGFVRRAEQGGRGLGEVGRDDVGAERRGSARRAARAASTTLNAPAARAISTTCP